MVGYRIGIGINGWYWTETGEFTEGVSILRQKGPFPTRHSAAKSLSDSLIIDPMQKKGFTQDCLGNWRWKDAIIEKTTSGKWRFAYPAGEKAFADGDGFDSPEEALYATNWLLCDNHKNSE